MFMRATCGSFLVVCLTPFKGWVPDGCQFVLVFNDGNFNEFETFLLSDWLHHTPKEVLAENYSTPQSTFRTCPPESSTSFRAVCHVLSMKKRGKYTQ
jgi:oxalate decarboxylase